MHRIAIIILTFVTITCCAFAAYYDSLVFLSSSIGYVNLVDPSSATPAGQDDTQILYGMDIVNSPWKDYSTNLYCGIPGTGVARPMAGAGKAYFNGTNTLVSPTKQAADSNGFTVAIWFDQNAAVMDSILLARTSYISLNWSLWRDSASRLYFAVVTNAAGTAGNRVTTCPMPNTTNLKFAVMCVTNSNTSDWRMYIDGTNCAVTEVTAGAIQGLATNPAHRITVAHYEVATSYHHKGNIFTIYYYNQMLLADEIAALYAAGKNNTNPAVIAGKSPQLMYTFASRINDSSAKTNDGTGYDYDWQQASNSISAHWSAAAGGLTSRVECVVAGLDTCRTVACWYNTNGIWRHAALIAGTNYVNGTTGTWAGNLWQTNGTALTWGSNTLNSRLDDCVVRSGTTNANTAWLTTRTNHGWSQWYHTNDIAGTHWVTNLALSASYESPFGAWTQDETTNNLHGIISGAVWTQQPVSAFYFDGVDDYITHGNVCHTGPMTGHITFSVWIKMLTGGSGGIGGRVKPTNLTQWYMYFSGDNGYLRWGLNCDGGGVLCDTLAVYRTNVWYHLVGTYSDEDNLGKLYVDGTLAVSSNVAGNVFNTANDALAQFTVGGLWNNNAVTFPFKGWIDTPRVFSNALNSAAVTNLYNSAASKYGKPTI